jgi:hypothetical protein
MPRPPHNKGMTNEVSHPYVVEVAFVSDGHSDGLDVELSRRIMQFHKSRHIQPRYGRTITGLDRRDHVQPDAGHDEGANLHAEKKRTHRTKRTEAKNYG